MKRAWLRWSWSCRRDRIRGARRRTDDCAFCDLFDALHDDEEGPGPSGKAQAALEAPPAPTNLRVEAVTDSSARVRWDAADGATDYDVNYRTAVGGRWTNWPHRGAAKTYSTVYGLEPNTEYRWAARSENSDGPSEWVFGPKRRCQTIKMNNKIRTKKRTRHRKRRPHYGSRERALLT